MAEQYYVSKKYHEISILAKETAKQMSKNREEWTKYLTTAARLYKYPFEDQMLIYAQEPDATACATMETWNEKMFCWVNRGAKGIALFDRESERPRLKYVFDVSDVHKSRRIGKDPYLWEIREEHKDAVLAQLEKIYGVTDKESSFENRLMEIAGRIAEDYYEELMQDMFYAKENSFLEELDELNVGLRLRETLSASIAYTLLSRCGADMDLWKDELNFDYISEFNTTKALSVIGNATTDMCKPVLMEIGRTVAAYDRQIERQKAVDKTKEKADGGQSNNIEKNPKKVLANTPELRYNALKRESENEPQTETITSHIETEGIAHGTDIREERGLSDTQPDTGQRAGGAADQVRADAQELSEGTPEGDLQRTSADGRTESTLFENTGAGRGENGLPDGADGESRGSGRGTESVRPDEMGGEDERNQALGGGNRTDGAGIQPVSGETQLNMETEKPDNDRTSGENSLSGSFLENLDFAEKAMEIQKELLCADDFLIHKRPEIAGYFAMEQDTVLQTEYFKNCFRFGIYYELEVSGTSIGFHASDNGLHINMTEKAGAENETLLSWEDARFFVNSYIEDDVYLLPGEKAEQLDTNGMYQQIDLFSMFTEQVGGTAMKEAEQGIVPAEKAVSETKKETITKEQLDTILRSGGGRENSRKRIYAKYQQGKTPEEMAAFLKKEYGTTGKGFEFEGKQVAVWFDEQGLSIGHGTSALEHQVLTMDWKEIETQIRSQVENGTYMGADEAYLVDEVERGRIANYLYFFFRDGMGEMPEELEMKAGGFPDSHARLVDILSTPEGVDMAASHMDKALAQLESGEKKLRFRSVMSKEKLRAELDNLLLEKKTFPVADRVEVKKEDFITQDEIDHKLGGGSSFHHGSFRIYDYFMEGHDNKEAVDFLKHEYGTGGCSHALVGADHSYEDHDFKGISLKKGNLSKPYADVLLPWKAVEKRIRKLIQEDKYLSPKGKEAYAEYKEEQAQKELEKAQAKIERDTKVSCKDAIDRAIAENFDGRRLPKGTAEGVIREYGIERISYVLANTIMHRRKEERISPENKEWAKSVEPYAMYESRDIVAASHPAVLNGFINQARRYIEREKELAAQIEAEQAQAQEDLPEIAEAEVFSRFEGGAEPGFYYAISITSDASADSYYISVMDGSTGEEIQSYRDSHGDMPTFETVDEAVDYCRRNGIDFENAAEVDQWHTIDVECQNDIDHRRQEPEYLYQMEANPRSKSANDSFFLQAYEKEGNGKSIPRDVLFVGTPEQCRELLGKLETGELTPEQVKGIFAQGQEPETSGHNVQKSETKPEPEKAEPEKPDYKVGDTVTIEGTEFIIEDISDREVQLRDPKLLYPIFRAESKENFERLLAEEAENTLSEPDMKIPAKQAEPKIDKSGAVNFHITEDFPGTGGAKVGAGFSPKEKFRKNIEAIRTLEKIEGENRIATPEEQKILSQYVGWGGLADAFDETKANWAGEYQELKTLLSQQEYASARESTLNAHYTSPVIIRSIYEALEKMGFEKGNILEPAMGIGNFFGMLPEKMQESRLYGVELDGITGRIAKQLYPKANIKISGFEKTDYPNDFFDVAIGNVPFGQYKVSDRQYDKNNFLIHDYFFAKTLDKVRSGGVVAFVTSKGTMDKKSPEVRKYLAQRAELLGAVRLPNTAFKENAGTEVTSDILFLKKLDRVMDIEPEWVHLTEKDGVVMNSYFADHPEMVVGKMEMVSGPYGMESTCQPDTSRPFAEQLQEAVSRIDGELEAVEIDELAEETGDNVIPADPNVKNYSYTLVDNKVYYRENSIMKSVDMTDTMQERIKGMVAIRDCTQELISLQLEEYPDTAITEKQAELNSLYDSFSKKYGIISSQTNRRAFNQDSSYCLLCSLEKTDDEGNFKGKADIFTKRTIKKAEVVTSVDTATEALAVSLSEKAKVDLDYMAELSGKDTDTIKEELAGVIFQNPVTDKWETADAYLSGNVRDKLETAKIYAENHPEYAVNVQALTQVQPKELDASEIEVRIGATWIEPKYIEDFMRDTFETPQHLFDKKLMGIQFSDVTGQWNVKGKNADHGNSLVNMTYGTSRRNAYTILEDSLNLKDSRVYDTIVEDGKEKRVLNKQETTIASQKQEAVREAFKDWVFREAERRQDLVGKYNKLFNSTRPREYDGSHLKFPGMTPDIELRPHQLNAVAHQLYGDNTLLAHCVGAGKTFEMIAAAMESKRLGLCQKSLFVVPNHLTEQWAGDFLRLYPGANILAATKKDFEPANRKKFCSRIATGDYDAVIIGHTQFEKIPLSQERQAAIIEHQIDEIETAIAMVKADNGERYTIKQMEKTKKSLSARLEKLNDTTRKDNVVTFEQLGVDRLFVDESHNYKNLFLYTKMRNVAGIAQTEAQKSSDMFAKCHYLDDVICCEL